MNLKTKAALERLVREKGPREAFALLVEVVDGAFKRAGFNAKKCFEVVEEVRQRFDRGPRDSGDGK